MTDSVMARHLCNTVGMPGHLSVMEAKISMYEKAREIAEEHFRRTNPTMWDGIGEPPATFCNRRITYSINRCTELDVSFEQTAEGWRHCCKLRDTLTGNLLAVRYGPGIHSPIKLAETILEIYKELEESFDAHFNCRTRAQT